jgi:hypothetical protein
MILGRNRDRCRRGRAPRRKRRVSLDDEVWDETVFTKNREHLIKGDIARKFMASVLDQGPV